jgi:hypothetical protein
MIRPIYTCFHTPGLYAHEATRLRNSLNRLGLDHDIRQIESRGDWVANSRYTARHICTMMANYPIRPLVQLDADAVVWNYPWLFDELSTMGMDIAIHYRKGSELLNGTVWLNCTSGARLVAERYRDLIEANPDCTNEQTMLAKVIDELTGQIRIFKLPANYCFIADLMKHDLAEGEQVVIEQLQASRETRQSVLTLNRRARIAEIDGSLQEQPRQSVPKLFCHPCSD